MWGYSKDVVPELLQLHLQLSNSLAHLSWNRVQIWKNATSVHEWSFGKNSFAFDVTLTSDVVTLTLIVRDNSQAERLRLGLGLEGITFKQNTDRAERFILKSFNPRNKDEYFPHLLEAIEKSRRSVELTMHESLEYIDSDTELTIR